MSGIVFVVIALAVLAVCHELAHFWMARAFGFDTPVFGFGLPFGPYKTLGKCGGTEIRIHALLLGAYVTIPDLDPPFKDGGETSSHSQSVRTFPLWQKLCVVLAGIGFQITFAWVILFVSLIVIGQPIQQALVRGFSPENPIAANAGLKVDDVIDMLDSHPIGSVDQVVQYFSAHPGTSVTVIATRGGKPVTLKVTPNSHGKVGAMLQPKMSGEYQRLFPDQSFSFSGQYVLSTTFNLIAACSAKMSAVFKPVKLAPDQMSSEYQFWSTAPEILAQDPRMIPAFIAVVSVALGLLHLVPLPGWDGGHMCAILFNAVKPKSAKGNRILRALYFIAFLLMIAATKFPLCMLRGRHADCEKEKKIAVDTER